MPEPHIVGRNLPLTALQRQDKICDRFEAAWREGQAPSIEELLPEVTEAERPDLFVALLRVERDWRKDAPGPVEYRFRFPAFAELVDYVFHDPGGTIAAPGPERTIRPPQIAGYDVSEVIGQGGMGVVFRAHHIGLNRRVAIKMVRAGPHRPDQLARFDIEARAIAGLNHPNVVTLYDFGQTDGQPYLVMELVEGGSLAARLAGKPADAVWAAAHVEQLARAVHHLHERKIIHRDLKPANVLLAEDGTPKISDFGLAKWLANNDPGVTETFAVLGTACYMSPEQARGDSKSVGPASDVYALGGILYECLTGRPPYRAATYALTIAQLLAEDPPRPSELTPGLSTDLEAICMKCLERDPGRRYLALELAEDLARFRQNLPVLARPVEEAERHARWARRIGYEIGGLLERDERSCTYLARQAAIQRTVRLKLCGGPVGSPIHAALRREADAMAGLDHPNLIRLYDYGEQFGQAYLVLEHIEGGMSLASRPTSMTARQAAETAIMLAIGLQAVHENGWIHGGIQPEAVLLTRDGVPKIGHFSAAQRQAGADIGPAADIHSLGATLRELLTSEPAEDELDRELAAIIEKCLERDPHRRYATAGSFSLAVQLALTPRANQQASDDSERTVAPDGAPDSDATVRFLMRIVRGPDSTGTTFDVPRYRVMIGRRKGSDVFLNGRDVSRDHAAIRWNAEKGCHEIVDLGARHGTFVNSKRLKGVRRLAAGDEIGIATYTLRFERMRAMSAENGTT